MRHSKGDAPKLILAFVLAVVVATFAYEFVIRFPFQIVQRVDRYHLFVSFFAHLPVIAAVGTMPAIWHIWNFDRVRSGQDIVLAAAVLGAGALVVSLIIHWWIDQIHVAAMTIGWVVGGLAFGALRQAFFDSIFYD